jgi:hypothetical protein
VVGLSYNVEQMCKVTYRKQVTGHCGIMQMEAATARAAKSADDAHAAADLASAQLADATAGCAKLQHQLDRQILDTARLRDAAAQQAADAAAEAADRLDQALAEQRLQLQGGFDARLLQQGAAAAGALQKALDDAHEHRRMLLEQAASERSAVHKLLDDSIQILCYSSFICPATRCPPDVLRYKGTLHIGTRGIYDTTIYVLCCRRQQEDARAAEAHDIRQAHHAEMQQQAAAHAALCRELHARAEADAEAAAQLAADAAASQQVVAASRSMHDARQIDIDIVGSSKESPSDDVQLSSWRASELPACVLQLATQLAADCFHVKRDCTLITKLHPLQAAAQLAAEAAAAREGQLRGALARVSEDFQVIFTCNLFMYQSLTEVRSTTCICVANLLLHVYP